MFAAVKRRMYEQVRSEGLVEGIAEGREKGITGGRAETNAEWQTWLDCRTNTGVFVPDDNDPSPSQRKA